MTDCHLPSDALLRTMVVDRFQARSETFVRVDASDTTQGFAAHEACALVWVRSLTLLPIDTLNPISSMTQAIDEVELLLRNARLRDELEPYIDESVSLVHFRQMNLKEENCFLESMLAWERAPAMPISEWFHPPLRMPAPHQLDEDLLRNMLDDTVDRLFSVRVVLEMTDHLSDRELYTLIYRDIMPACEKKIDLPGNYLCWRCLDESDIENWLRYYATETERLQYIQQNMQPVPEPQDPPYPRKLPRASEL